MNYTDIQLKLALEKMLPEKIVFRQFTEDFGYNSSLYWKNKNQFEHEVLDTELLHLCWLVETALTPKEQDNYIELLAPFCKEYSSNTEEGWLLVHHTWQQRVIALAKVKRIEL